MKDYPLSLLLIALLLIPFVSADYSNYIGQGDTVTNSDYKISGVFTANITMQGMSPSSGTDSEAISYDFDKDGQTELIYFGGDNNTYMTRSPDPTYVIDAVSIGQPRANPAVCDLNVDGVKEYIGIFRIGTQDTLYVMEVENNSLIVKYSENVSDTSNTTSIYGGVAWNPIRCYPFYGHFYTGSNPSSLAQYAIWLDQNKQVHLFTTYGGVNNETVIDVNADHYEAAAANKFLYSHDIIVDNTFDKGGEVTLQFVAGDMFIVMDENNNVYTKNISSGLTSSGTSGTLRLQGGYRNRLGGGTGTVYYTAISGTTAIVGQSYGTTNLFGADSINMLPYTSISGGAATFSTAINKYSVGSKDNILSFATEQSGSSITYITIVDSGNMTTIDSLTLNNFLSSQASPYRINAYSIQGDIYVATMNSIVRVEPSNISVVWRVFNFTNGGSSLIPVNLDSDGYLDWMSSGGPSLSPKAYLSSIYTVTPSQVNFPFSVWLNSTQNISNTYVATTKVTLGFNDTEGIYNYALVCDLNEYSLWNEQFKYGYNFSSNNVGTNFADPEEYLTYSGIVFPINSSTPQFDLFKQASTGYYDSLRQHFTMVRTGDNTIDYIVYDDDSLITYWLRFNKNGSNGTIERVYFGDTTVNIANYTIGVVEDITIEYKPEYDFSSNSRYFTTIIKNSGVPIANDSSFSFDGQNIKDVELYSASENTTLRITQLGLFKISNPTPEFVQFQNGQVINESGFTTTNPPPQGTITGEGCTVIADYNNIFYSRCSYNNPGVYTQRHFIAATNTPDYSNYKDITIDVTQEVAAEDTLEGKASTSPISGFFFSFIKDGITALVVGLIISLVLAVLCAGVTAYFVKGAGGFLLVVVAGLGFVVGLIATWAIGLTPLWVILLLVIISAALVALAFRFAVSGG